MKETNIEWIKFYKDKLARIERKIDKLDKEDSYYWPKLTKLLNTKNRVSEKLGISC